MNNQIITNTIIPFTSLNQIALEHSISRYSKYKQQIVIYSVIQYENLFLTHTYVDIFNRDVIRSLSIAIPSCITAPVDADYSNLAIEEYTEEIIININNHSLKSQLLHQTMLDVLILDGDKEAYEFEVLPDKKINLIKYKMILKENLMNFRITDCDVLVVVVMNRIQLRPLPSGWGYINHPNTSKSFYKRYKDALKPDSKLISLDELVSKRDKLNDWSQMIVDHLNDFIS